MTNRDVTEHGATLFDARRDARLRKRSRDAIRYELIGAGKDGIVAPGRGDDESWDELCHHRDVLDLLRERDDARSALRYIAQRYGRLDGVGWDRVLP